MPTFEAEVCDDGGRVAENREAEADGAGRGRTVESRKKEADRVNRGGVGVAGLGGAAVGED